MTSFTESPFLQLQRHRIYLDVTSALSIEVTNKLDELVMELDYLVDRAQRAESRASEPELPHARIKELRTLFEQVDALLSDVETRHARACGSAA